MIDFNALKKPYFIAEIGINHNGDLQIAKRLIDAAFGCEWDCVKFQKRNPDVAVPEDEKKKPRETQWGTMTYLEYKHRIEFGKKDYDYIDSYCEQKPIDWTVSVWDVDSLQFALHYDLEFLKIPSAMITNLELLREAAASGLPLLLSTGMSTLKEIDTAVEVISAKSRSYALLHCTSTYPAPYGELNLRVIPLLMQRYGCTIGYSGHEYDLEPSVIAVALGAKIIERHITLDHTMWGTDQAASLEVHAMSLLKRRVANIEEMLGSSEKSVTKGELPIRKKLRGV